MKLLLTSAGVSNASIDRALVGLLGKPVSESTALFVPTGAYPFEGGAGSAYRAITGAAPSPLCGLGWKSLGVLELTALPTLRPESWVPAVREADALLVWGGDVLYLTYWLKKSGLADLLSELEQMVYVGVSAGSIAVTSHNFDAEFDLGLVPEGSDLGVDAEKGLGLVDFTLVPHFDAEGWEDRTAAAVETWASGIPVPTYGIDNETAIQVVNSSVEVVSEGHWRLFDPAS